jgi:HSP20 family molecular chaperone IbpA
MNTQDADSEIILLSPVPFDSSDFYPVKNKPGRKFSPNVLSWSPPTDLCEYEDRFVVRVEIAGMHKTDFLVELSETTLSISGIRVDNSERRAYHQMEIHYGDFLTIIELPVSVKNDAIELEYSNGFFWVTLPKGSSLS